MGEGAPECRASIVSTESKLSVATAGLLIGDFWLRDVSRSCFAALCAAPDCEVSPGNAVPQLTVSSFTGRAAQVAAPSAGCTATSADMRAAFDLARRDERRGVT